MQIKNGLFRKVKTKAGNQTDPLVMFFLAVAMVIMALAVNYVFNYSLETFSKENAVTYWEYIYTDYPKESFGGELRTANGITPMSMEKTGSYLHMRTRIKECDEDQTLVFKTDYSPVRILVNGKEVYNNHYTDAEYVGNTYNAVTIPASSDTTLVEVSARLPFSARVKAVLKPGAAKAGFPVSAGSIFALILFSISVCMIGFAIFFRITKHRRMKFPLLFLIMCAYSATVLLYAFSGSSYLVNFPQYYNITLAVSNLCIALFLMYVMILMKVRSKLAWSCLGIFAVLSVLIIPVSTVTYLKLAFLAAGIFGMIAILTLANLCRSLFSRRIQYSMINYLMLLSLSMFYLLGSAMFFSIRYRSDFRYCTLIGAFIFSGFMIVAFVAQAISYRDPRETNEKIKTNDNCVNVILGLMKNVLNASDETEICERAAEGICELCRSLSKMDEQREIEYSAVRREGMQYRPICSSPVCADVNFDIIERRYEESELRCLINETYFDFIVPIDGGDCIIFHFENIINGLDPFLNSALETLCSCINIAMLRFSASGDYLHAQEKVLVKLANDTEISGGNNPDHLESVRVITMTIMRAMGYDEHICDMVSNAAMLHDIGKIAIPNEITNKKGLLSEDERMIIKNHTLYGYQLLSAFNGEFMGLAATIANEHHEDYSGSGYIGLAGDSINEFARIVRVADVIDALTSKRSYKDPWPFDTVIEYIDERTGKAYDPAVVKAIHSCIDEIRTVITEKNK